MHKQGDSQVGLAEPISGRLFRPHIFEENVSLDWSAFANCAIEPELVLRIGEDLRGDNLSDADLIGAIEYVSPGIEIHNFRFWQLPPAIQDLICSGGIHAGFIVGNARVSPGDLQFRDEIFSVYKNENLITSAPASEIMGGPLRSLRWGVSFLTAKGCPLKKDSLVISGPPVELVEIRQNTELRVAIERVGSMVAFSKRRNQTNR